MIQATPSSIFLLVLYLFLFSFLNMFFLAFFFFLEKANIENPPHRNEEEGRMRFLDVFVYNSLFFFFGSWMVTLQMIMKCQSISLFWSLNFWWYDIFIYYIYFVYMKWIFSIITLTSIYVKSLYYQTEIRREHVWVLATVLETVVKEIYTTCSIFSFYIFFFLLFNLFFIFTFTVFITMGISKKHPNFVPHTCTFPIQEIN